MCSVRRSGWVRNCPLCRVPWGKFRVNGPSHGNSFSLSFFHSLSLFLCGQHIWDWVTTPTHSCLSSFLSFCLNSSLSLSQFSEHSTYQECTGKDIQPWTHALGPAWGGGLCAWMKQKAGIKCWLYWGLKPRALISLDYERGQHVSWQYFTKANNNKES